MATLRKARSNAAPDLEVSRRELVALPARLLTQLPVETRIYVQASGTKTEFVLTTASDAPIAPKGSGRKRPCWLAASELDALVIGVEAERTSASDLTSFALRKLHDRSFRVTAEHALGGTDPGDDLRPMSLGEVLEVLDLEITGIELGPMPSEAQPLSAHAA
jgi:hypothetical protein